MKNSDKPAYPLNPESTFDNENGLTKREYFAAMAMQGILSSRELYLAIIRDGENPMVAAIEYADELLKQLEK